MTVGITIAIPFHHGREYLRAAIESVLGQRDDDWRLLVCDDAGEEPGADELVRSFADERLEYQRNERNLGMVANWNRCIERARSDWVTLLHADDLLLPGYVGLMRDLARRHPEAAACFCDAIVIDAQGRRRFSLPDAVKRWFVPGGSGDLVLEGEPAVRALVRGNFLMCPTLCYRKSAPGGARFDESWRQVQDLEFTTRLLMRGGRLVGARRAEYAYRRHPQSATTRQSESLLRFEEEFALFGRIAERAEGLGWQSVARVARRASIVRLHLLYRIVREALALHPRRSLATARFLLARSPARPASGRRAG